MSAMRWETVVAGVGCTCWWSNDPAGRMILCEIDGGCVAHANSQTVISCTTGLIQASGTNWRLYVGLPTTIAVRGGNTAAILQDVQIKVPLLYNVVAALLA